MGLSNFASTFETTSEKESSSTVPKDAGDHVVAVDTLSSPQQTAARRRKEIYGNTITDPVLAQKMELVNDAIDEIGMTPFHWKLFFLNGFGYAVESVRAIAPRHILRSNRIASYCMCFNCEPGRYKGIWDSNQTNCWHTYGKSSRFPSWCGTMGHISRYNWSTISV